MVIQPITLCRERQTLLLVNFFFSMALHRNWCSGLTGYGWVWLLRGLAEIQHLVCRVPLQQEVCAYAGIASTVWERIKSILESCSLGKCAHCYTSSEKQTVAVTWQLSCLGWPCLSLLPHWEVSCIPLWASSPSCPVASQEYQKYCSKRPFI